MPTIKLIKEGHEEENKLYYVEVDNKVIENTKCKKISEALCYYDMHRSILKTNPIELKSQLHSQFPTVLMQETI